MKEQICVKITVYDGFHPDRVVYYRNKLPMRLISKWRWYFEYLAARIKVKHPRRRVELTICAQTLLQGQEYIDSKRETLLRAKRSKVKKLESTAVSQDLFGFGQREQDEKLEAVREEVEALERGEFNYYVPVENINEVKEWI